MSDTAQAQEGQGPSQEELAASAQPAMMAAPAIPAVLQYLDQLEARLLAEYDQHEKNWLNVKQANLNARDMVRLARLGHIASQASAAESQEADIERAREDHSDEE